MTAEGLPRSWRLSRPSDLRAVMQQGRRSRTPRIELYWISNAFAHPRLAVIVPRYGGTVVVRNRLRRRLREWVRRHLLPHLTALDLVVRARPEAYRASPMDLAQDLGQWLCSVGP